MSELLGHPLHNGLFMPHGQCYLWQADLLWLHVISDALIVLSYYSIPFALLYVVNKRSDIKYSWIYTLFGTFIFLCGTTHLLSIWTVWVPDYWLAGIVKLFTAAVSLGTAILIWPLIPRILSIPSHEQLMVVNSALEQEVDRHQKTENELLKFSVAIEHSSSIIVITNADGVIEYCNPNFYQLTGFQPREVVGFKPSIFKSNLTDPAIYHDLWTTITSGDSWRGEFLDRKKNGELFWCLQSIAPIKNEQNQITHYVSVAQDISERKTSEDTIRHLAFFDPLTDLPNRVLFKDRLEQAIYHSKRSNDLFALMYLDLDRFKNINDTLGHLIGDKLLIEVGRRITTCLRDRETIARLGGDEFAVIGLDLRSPTDAGDIAQRILNAVNGPLTIDGHEMFISTSIGISIYPTDAQDMDQLIKYADSALYQAKGSGRNAFEFFNEGANTSSLRRLTLEKHLHHALSRNELSLLYQPKIDVKTQAMVGVEALLRWESPEGNISPDEFIPIAEDTGLIVDIGAWVLKKACQDCLDWQRRHNIRMPVAINLSARQFKQHNLLATIDDAMAETAIHPELLEFELTESMLMDNPDHAIDIMRKIKERGSKLAIDDFGTGYSSLSYLKRFPVDTLKIDKSFVNDIPDNQDDAIIVSSVIALAHSMGMRVIAEGVETLEQLQFLDARQCDEAQGYYFCQPISAEGIVAEFAKCADALADADVAGVSD